MEVTNVRTTVVGTPWRDLVFVELETDTGLTGVGEVRPVNKTDSFVATVEELAGRYVMGADPFDTEKLSWAIERLEYGRPSEHGQSALAAFDIACFDLMGQQLGVPVWKLFGGCFRDRVPAYANGWYQADYQRVGGDEPFGYKGGVRNMLPRAERPTHVFIHPDREIEEPRAANGGSYRSFLRIVQTRQAFAALADDATRDAIIGRRRDGRRLYLDGIAPEHEPADTPVGLPPSSHVRKAGPRGPHDDVQILRRGLPFLDLADGQARTGLNFASFQSSLDQLDTVLNDWISPRTSRSKAPGRIVC